jgi:hypothetical protein
MPKVPSLRSQHQRQSTEQKGNSRKPRLKDIKPSPLSNTNTKQQERATPRKFYFLRPIDKQEIQKKKKIQQVALEKRKGVGYIQPVKTKGRDGRVPKNFPSKSLWYVGVREKQI